ncbi:MAG: DUF3592 domain-containing protein [Isosphaeraceae bacterium]
MIVWGFLLPDWRANRYLPTSCVALDKRLGSQMFPDTGVVNGQAVKGQKESYRPEIKIGYEIDGRKFETWAYDAVRMYSPDRAAQQAIVDSFQVGATYPCWYDPDQPEHAILVRGHAWGVYVLLILPVGLLIVGGVGLLMAWTLAAWRPGPVASDGRLPQIPIVSGLIQGLQVRASSRNTIDASRFGDPVATMTDWTPANSGGASFRSHTLVEVDPERMEFRASAMARLMYLGFSLAGVLILIFSIAQMRSTNRMGLAQVVLVPLAGLLFVGVGGALYYFGTVPIVFDKRKGFYWKGRETPDNVFDGNALKDAAGLGEIHAVQLLSHFVHGRNSYYSYELNLVLKDGKRLNVVSHGNRGKLREDASTLAQFLGKPVWDAI